MTTFLHVKTFHESSDSVEDSSMPMLIAQFQHRTPTHLSGFARSSPRGSEFMRCSSPTDIAAKRTPRDILAAKLRNAHPALSLE